MKTSNATESGPGQRGSGVDLEKVEETLSEAGEYWRADTERREIVETSRRQYPIFKEGKDPDSPWIQVGIE